MLKIRGNAFLYFISQIIGFPITINNKPNNLVIVMLDTEATMGMVDTAVLKRKSQLWKMMPKLWS